MTKMLAESVGSPSRMNPAWFPHAIRKIILAKGYPGMRLSMRVEVCRVITVNFEV